MPSNLLSEILPGLFSEKGEVKPEVRKLDEHHEKERSSFLGEIVESAMARWTPGLSKFMDVLSSVGVTNKDPEVVSRQNELEGFTAWSIFIPDRFLRIVTDPIVNIPGFATLVKLYPLGDSLEEDLLDSDGNIKSDYDPDDVISFIRLIHQDFISGKSGVDSFIN